MIREIADGIFVQPGRYVEEKRGLVHGTQWCILIDAPRHFDEAEELKHFAAENSKGGVRLAVLTHGHLDHIATLQEFGDITVIATESARQYMQGKGQQELDRMKQHDQELQRVRQILPTVAVTGEAIIFDGTGRSLRCIPAPGHSMDSQMVFIEPERILFTGDTLSSVVPPYFPDGRSDLLEKSLERIAELAPEIVVPGHGPVMSGRQIEQEKFYAVSYLEHLRNRVQQEVDHGDSVDLMRMEIPWKDCSGKPPPTDEYLAYHLENIGNMAAEIYKEKASAEAEPSPRM